MPEPRKGAQKFSFQAEVSRLMDIIIHSLYSNKVWLAVDQHRVCLGCCCLANMHTSWPSQQQA